MGLGYFWPAGNVLSSHYKLRDNGDVSERQDELISTYIGSTQEVQLIQMLVAGKTYVSRSWKGGTTCFGFFKVMVKVRQTATRLILPANSGPSLVCRIPDGYHLLNVFFVLFKLYCSFL